MMYIELNYEDINVKLKELKGIYFVYMLILHNKVVYIGCTQNPYKRFKDHRYQKTFESIEMFSMPGHRQAKEKEKELIFKHKPIHNGNGKHTDKHAILNSDIKRIVPPEELKAIHSSILRR